jgi:hypothetical protein
VVQGNVLWRDGRLNTTPAQNLLITWQVIDPIPAEL